MALAPTLRYTPPFPSPLAGSAVELWREHAVPIVHVPRQQAADNYYSDPWCWVEVIGGGVWAGTVTFIPASHVTVAMSVPSAPNPAPDEHLIGQREKPAAHKTPPPAPREHRGRWRPWRRR